MTRLLMAWLLLLCAQPLASSAEVPLADFARNDSYDDATISPAGSYVALTVPLSGGRGLAVLELATGKIILKQSMGKSRSIANYIWANDHRLVISLAEDLGVLEHPVPIGEMIAVDADGGHPAYLFGVRAERLSGSRLAGGRDPRAAGWPIRALPTDPDHILIQSRPFVGKVDDRRDTVYRMSVKDGALDRPVKAPMPGGTMQFVADRAGFVRYATGGDDHNRLHTFARTPEQPEWAELESPTAGKQVGAEPLFLSNDSKRVFLQSNEGGDLDCLIEQRLDDGRRRSLACAEDSDLIDVIRTFDGNEPVAARFADGRQDLRLLDVKNPSRNELAELLKAFPGQHVQLRSTTDDGGRAIVLVDSDRNPGDYYLFDTATLKAEYLVGRSAWLDPEQMPERRPISFVASDGQRIRGYLTLPRGRAAKQLPMVVNPHGGPFHVRDDWNFDADAAALATRGYAVLQVNFRGSGGYGQAFVNAGKLGWATTMISDIADGTRWAIEEGIADPARIGIYGASYGGYAALMSAIREPTLFRSVTTYVGVYDLPSWKESSDVSQTRSTRNYVDEFIGGDIDSLRAASPSTFIDYLKAPVFIAHGEQDERVPFTQAKALRKALFSRDRPYEWLPIAGEGHGFVVPENRTLFLTRLIAFLDRTLAPVP